MISFFLHLNPSRIYFREWYKVGCSSIFSPNCFSIMSIFLFFSFSNYERNVIQEVTKVLQGSQLGCVGLGKQSQDTGRAWSSSEAMVTPEGREGGKGAGVLTERQSHLFIFFYQYKLFANLKYYLSNNLFHVLQYVQGSLRSTELFNLVLLLIKTESLQENFSNQLYQMIMLLAG